MVVEDAITTGGSTREVIDAVRPTGARVVAVGCLIDRSTGVDLGVPHRSLIRLEVPAWKAEACPLCAAGSKPEKPGSRSQPCLATARCVTASPSPTTAPTSRAGRARRGEGAARPARTVQGAVEDALARLAPAATRRRGRRGPHRHRRPRPRPGRLVRPAARDAAAATSSAPSTASCPRTSACCGARAAPEGFHARKSAVSKLYRYVLDTGPVQLPTRRAPGRARAVHARSRPRVGGGRALRRPPGLRLPVLGRRLGAHHRARRPAARRRAGRSATLVYEVEADGFLRKMVRSMVGGLVEAGRRRVARRGPPPRARRARPPRLAGARGGARPHARRRPLPGRSRRWG